MDIASLLRLALAALRRNLTRAILTMLGIVIGVAAVVAMIGIGEGSRRASQALVQNLGANTLMIFNGAPSSSRMGPMAMGSVEVLRPEDAELIEGELGESSVVAVTPQVRTQAPVIYQDQNTLTSIQGTGVRFPLIQAWDLAQGRSFTDREVRGLAKVCVLGSTVAATLFLNREDPVGQVIRIGRIPFEVIGVLASKGAGMMGDQDDVVVAPYTTVLHRLLGRDRIQALMASALEGRADQAEAEITALLRQRLRLGAGEESTFTIRKQDDLKRMMDQQADVMTLFLALAAGISLVVGGIGISNIMLVSVTERTREIGLRRAVGATRSAVLFQFLAEAALLALVGGLGILLALGALGVLRGGAGLPAVATPGSMGLGLALGCFVGIAAGFLPALKASRLDINDALRFE